jgi:hypothetical protein
MATARPEESSRECTLAYWHKPLFSSGAAHGNDPEVKPLWDALYSADAEIVIGRRQELAPEIPDPTAKCDRRTRSEF